MRLVQILPLALLMALPACKEAPSEPGQSTPAKSKLSRAAAGEIGSALPSFKATDLNGKPFGSADLKNKVVIINFWATWCPPCKKEMPGFQELQDRYGKDGFLVIGFKSTMMADSEDPFQFITELGVKYPIVPSTVDIERKFGGLFGLPTTFIYDRQGVLRHKVIGFEDTKETEAVIKSLL